MGIDDKLLEEIIRRILTVERPERIIMFGSAATGTMNRDSDIDLLVLKEEWDEPRMERYRIRKALRGMERPFDVIVMRSDYFERTKSVIGGLAYPANKYGRVIYEAAR
ncbi:MAG TPA: nucleotidyltransferase domain-containing protein [bacterium]|nr:nucleotidyltransferase domain-containing protein [bacterium]